MTYTMANQSFMRNFHHFWWPGGMSDPYEIRLKFDAKPHALFKA